MGEKPDYRWVSEISSEIEEMADNLQVDVEGDERVEDIEYGLNEMLESPETYEQADGLLTDAESFDEITKYLSTLSLGTVRLNGPSEYPTTTYELDLVAEGNEKYWEISSIDADTKLNEHNNYVRTLEDEVENSKREGTGIERTTEGYQSDSAFVTTVANSC